MLIMGIEGAFLMMWTAEQEHAVKRLQYHFHTWRRQEHATCKVGVCHMQYDDRVSDEISVCSLDSLNVHLCTAAACKVVYFFFLKNIYIFNKQ